MARNGWIAASGRPQPMSSAIGSCSTLPPKLVVGIDPIDELADALTISLCGRRKIGETLVAERS